MKSRESGKGSEEERATLELEWKADDRMLLPQASAVRQARRFSPVGSMSGSWTTSQTPAASRV